MTLEPARLRSLPLFADLTEDESRLVASWVEEREILAGRRLTSEGGTGYSFFVIEDGTAEVVQDGHRLDVLGPGDFFGEAAILGDGRRTAGVAALAPLKLLVLFGTEFRRLAELRPDIAERIREAMQRRVGVAP